MDDVHGVDVSWLHRSAKGSGSGSKNGNHSTVKQARPPTPPPDRPPPHKSGEHETTPIPNHENIPSANPPKSQKKPGLLSRASSEKLFSSSTSPPEDAKSSKRPGWMSSLSSKFSSSQGQGSTNTSSPATQKVAESTVSTPSRPSTTPISSASSRPDHPSEDVEPYASPSKNTSSPSFLSSALRRLSTSGGTSASKAAAAGGLVPRRILNIDADRDRCLVQDLDETKLRRVAFSVDVEIAGYSKYLPEDHGHIEQDDQMKRKDKKVKERSEGETLKHPELAADNKDAKDTSDDGFGIDPYSAIGSTAKPGNAGLQEALKKEEEKAQELRRKAREEKKRRKAEAAAVVAETSKLQDGQDATPAPDRPTTDPLRVYRRCCALREAPVLKRIKEQLDKPYNTGCDTTGIVNVLDFTGSRMQMPDIVCVSDWLAIVPVRKVILENSNLADDGIRLLLAALLASRRPDLPKRKREKSDRVKAAEQKLGIQKHDRSPSVIEKLSLKNNPKITKEGWKHISLFINMSRSLKAIDLSMIPFPKPEVTKSAQEPSSLHSPKEACIAEIFSKAIAERLAGKHLEELTVSECNLTPYEIRKIVDAVTISGLSRLGLAGNSLTEESLEHVADYVRSGVCHGIDLASNNLRGKLDTIARAIHGSCPIKVLSVADCYLDPPSLQGLLSALCRAPDMRFIDLSHNHELFSFDSSALALLRKYLPRMPVLKMLRLNDAALSASDAIAIAEILPEIRNLCNINVLDNPKLQALANATDPDAQEEACALYASFMAASRVSKTLISVELDAPSTENSEIVRALAKQVLAYTLRNMDRFAAADAFNVADAAAIIPDIDDVNKGVDTPEVLTHLIGHLDAEGHQVDEGPAPDDDYLVGGAGMVKALNYFLGQKNSDAKGVAAPLSGNATPERAGEARSGNVKVNQVSKNLLASARRIHTTIVAAMAREGEEGDEYVRRRLRFLEQTLEGIIERFELEFPECRVYQDTLAAARKQSGVHDTTTLLNPLYKDPRRLRSTSNVSADSIVSEANTMSQQGSAISDDESEHTPAIDADAEGEVYMQRRPSQTSIANRALTTEEGTMLRLGQRVKHQIIKPNGTDDHLYGTSTNDPAEAEHLQALRTQMEEMGSEEIRDKMQRLGLDGTFKEFEDEAEELRALEMAKPQEFEAFRKAQLMAQANVAASRAKKGDVEGGN